MDKKEKITLSRRGLLFSYLAVALISTLVMVAGVSMMYAALDGIAIVVSAVFLIIGMVFFTGTTAMYKEQLKKFPVEEKKQNKGVILFAFAILELIAFALLFAGIFYVVCFPAIYWPTGIVMLLCGASLMTKSAIVYLKDTKKNTTHKTSNGNTQENRESYNYGTSHSISYGTSISKGIPYSASISHDTSNEKEDIKEKEETKEIDKE